MGLALIILCFKVYGCDIEEEFCIFWKFVGAEVRDGQLTIKPILGSNNAVYFKIAGKSPTPVLDSLYVRNFLKRGRSLLLTDMTTTTTTTSTTETVSKNNISKWKVSGDWFDVCKCTIPCPCEFA